MSYTNAYTAPAPPTLSEAELHGPEPYDVNFVFPLHPASLATARVQLVPFVPRVHGPHYWAEAAQHPDLLRYYPGVWPTYASILTYAELFVRRSPEHVLFAILDTTRPSAHAELGGHSLAGVIGLYHASPANLSAEIAFVVVLPPFQRTHVASNAVGALLRYCLELPNASPPGLGLRRVQWCAHTKNAASARLAERMGFRREGVARWNWVLPKELARDGETPREGDVWPEKPGRHTLVLSVCWDDWEGGVREVVAKNIDRTV